MLDSPTPSTDPKPPIISRAGTTRTPASVSSEGQCSSVCWPHLSCMSAFASAMQQMSQLLTVCVLFLCMHNLVALESPGGCRLQLRINQLGFYMYCTIGPPPPTPAPDAINSAKATAIHNPMSLGDKGIMCLWP
jgi:hypothetical protein